jgi:hypothetical protein
MVLRISFLYFSFLAWGCLALLPVVRLQEVGQGFYRFFGFLCVGLQTLALGLLLMGGFSGSQTQASAWALGASLFFTLCFTISLRIRVRWFLWVCFWLAVCGGFLGLGFFPWSADPDWWFLSIHAVISSLVLGAGILAMMLGHWYLVTPKLSITPLKRYAASYILLTVLTALELLTQYYFAVGFKPGFSTAAGTQLIRGELFFVLFRVTWGVAAPLGMAYWIWTTVKMRSTQSATGILYASMVCTMIGEGMGLYLTLRTGIPF